MSSSPLPAAAGPAAAADGDFVPVTASYRVHARVEPGVMPRVVELFAKRGLVPHKWHSTADGAGLTIDLQIGGLGRDAADYIGRCMRQITGVETVLSYEVPAAAG